MIDVIHKIYFGDTVSGDFAEVTVDSIHNLAILLGNESIHEGKRFVVYRSDIDNLIKTLEFLKETYL